MKYILAFLLVFSTFYVVEAQSSNELDKKNGFKDFKLGDKYSKWSSKLKYFKTNNEGISYYKYVGSCCQRVFEHEIESILLGFASNELEVIYLYTSEQSDDGYKSYQYESLVRSFTSMFGKGDEYVVDKSSGNIGTSWMGESVILNLEYQYLGIKENKTYGTYYTASKCVILVGKVVDLDDGF